MPLGSPGRVLQNPHPPWSHHRTQSVSNKDKSEWNCSSLAVEWTSKDNKPKANAFWGLTRHPLPGMPHCLLHCTLYSPALLVTTDTIKSGAMIIWPLYHWVYKVISNNSRSIHWLVEVEPKQPPRQHFMKVLGNLKEATNPFFPCTRWEIERGEGEGPFPALSSVNWPHYLSTHVQPQLIPW